MTQQTPNQPKISFEFFPPKTEKMSLQLWDTIKRLEPVQPHFVSVTYGAGGTTREFTHQTVRRIVKETSLTPAAHLTCVNASRDEVHQVAEEYWAAGVQHIVALRGDPPEGMGKTFAPHPQGYKNALELVEGLRAHRPEWGKCFEVSVACYPEPHPESRGWESDLALLKAKQDAGADRAITQFFFEPETFLRFREKAVAAGVTMPLVPGLMLQSNFTGLQRIAQQCHISVPDWLGSLYEGLNDDPQTRDMITANVAAELSQKLASEGVDQFHFYTLNKAALALSTCRLLGLRPSPKAIAA